MHSERSLALISFGIESVRITLILARFGFALFRLLVLALLATAAIQARAQLNFNLIAGWNLLGNSSSSPIDVAATYGDGTKIQTVWKWNRTASRWAFFAPSLDATTLASYAQTKGYDVLTSIAPKEGFWVNAITPVALAGPTAAGVMLAAVDQRSPIRSRHLE